MGTGPSFPGPAAGFIVLISLETKPQSLVPNSVGRTSKAGDLAVLTALMRKFPPAMADNSWSAVASGARHRFGFAEKANLKRRRRFALPAHSKTTSIQIEVVLKLHVRRDRLSVTGGRHESDQARGVDRPFGQTA